MANTHSRYKGRRDKRQVAAVRRQEDPRVKEAATKVALSRERLEARIELEQAEAARIVAERRVKDQQNAAAEADLRVAIEKYEEQARQEAKRERWPLGDARNLIREGYSLKAVMRRTGWPEKMLADVQQGEW